MAPDPTANYELPSLELLLPAEQLQLDEQEQEVRDRLVAAYRTDYYHVWTSTDFVGHEVGACMKNIFAFGGGVAAGNGAAGAAIWIVARAGEQSGPDPGSDWQPGAPDACRS